MKRNNQESHKSWLCDRYIKFCGDKAVGKSGNRSITYEPLTRNIRIPVGLSWMAY